MRFLSRVFCALFVAVSVVFGGFGDAFAAANGFCNDKEECAPTLCFDLYDMKNDQIKTSEVCVACGETGSIKDKNSDLYGMLFDEKGDYYGQYSGFYDSQGRLVFDAMGAYAYSDLRCEKNTNISGGTTFDGESITMPLYMSPKSASSSWPTVDMCEVWNEKFNETYGYFYDYLHGNPYFAYQSQYSCQDLISKGGNVVGDNENPCECGCENPGEYMDLNAAWDCWSSGQSCNKVCTSDPKPCEPEPMQPYLVDGKEWMCCYFYNPNISEDFAKAGCITSADDWGKFLDKAIGYTGGGYVGADGLIYPCPSGSHFDTKSSMCLCDATNEPVNINTGLCDAVVGYQITLDNNSATTAGTSTIYATSSNVYLDSGLTQIMTTGANEISIPTKTTYTFGGYYSGSDGTGTQYISANGKITAAGITAGTSLTANGTWYAKWTPVVSGAITLDSKRYESETASTGTTPSTTVSPTTLYTKYGVGVYTSQANANSGSGAITSLTRVPSGITGYNFDGFYTGKAGTGTQVIYSDGSLAPTAKTAVSTAGATPTWYAHWEPKTSYVYFTANSPTYNGMPCFEIGAVNGQQQAEMGGSNVMVYSFIATYGENLIPVPDFHVTKMFNNSTCNKYSFDGFYDATAGGTKYYNVNNTPTQTWDKEDEYVSLYAHWTQNPTYTVTLKDLDDTTTFDTIFYNSSAGWTDENGNSITSVDVPFALEGSYYRRFNGWYTAQNTGGTQIIDANGAITSNASVSGDTTLYGHGDKYVPVNFGAGNGGVDYRSPMETNSDPASSLTLYACVNCGSNIWVLDPMVITSMQQVSSVYVTPPAGYTYSGFKENNTTVMTGTTLPDSQNIQVGTQAHLWVAQYTPRTYTVTLNWAGNVSSCASAYSGMPSTVTATYNANMPTLTTRPNNSNTSCQFLGFYKSTSYVASEQYYNPSGNSAHVWDQAANATIYAKWGVECNAGYYKDSRDACVQCPAGSYCPGGVYERSSSDAGITTCPARQSNDFGGDIYAEPGTTSVTSDAGASKVTDCYITYLPKNCLATATEDMFTHSVFNGILDIPKDSDYVKVYALSNGKYPVNPDFIVPGRLFSKPGYRVNMDNTYKDSTGTEHTIDISNWPPTSPKSVYGMYGTSCPACNSGTFSHGTGYMIWESGTMSLYGQCSQDGCPIGTYSLVGSGTCTPCPAGKTTNSTFSKASNACVACSNAAGVATWETPSWVLYNSEGHPEAQNICVVKTCASGYYKSGNACLPYSVTFNANDGHLYGTSPLYSQFNYANLYTTAELSHTATVPNAGKTGYTFAGWYTDATGGSMVYNASRVLQQDVSGYISNGKWQLLENKTLYAQFSPAQYTVTYDCGTGTGGTAPANGSATYGSIFAPAANTCTKSGYAFAGWAVSGTNDVYANKFTWNYTQNKTLTAQWFEDKFQITTTSLAAGDAVEFLLTAQGTFYVDCGDGGTLDSVFYSATMPNNIIVQNDTSANVYKCSYTTSGVKNIRFGGLATDYNEGAPAISFSEDYSGNTLDSRGLIDAVSGNMSAVFPYISTNQPDGNQPRFILTFAGARNLTSVDHHLFDNYTTASTGMFVGTFFGTGLTSVPDGLFENITGVAPEAFGTTFAGASHISGYIPKNTFLGIIGNAPGAAGLWANTFDDTDLLDNCPVNTRDVDTGYWGDGDVPNSQWGNYAICETVNPFTITLNLNTTGATAGSPTTLYMQYNGSGLLAYSDAAHTTPISTITTPTKPGYAFAGFKVGNDTVVDSGGNIDTHLMYEEFYTGNKTANAQWNLGKYTITLNNTSATSAGTTKIYTTYNTNVYLDSGRTQAMTTSANGITVPTKTDYTFRGYYSGSGGTGTQYINALGKITQDGIDAGKALTANGIWYAGWEANRYTISYVLNSGTQATSGVPASYTYGVGATVNGTPTRTGGYTFAGWCTDSGLTSCAATQTISTTATGKKTFYAKWTGMNVSASNKTLTYTGSAQSCGNVTVSAPSGATVQYAFAGSNNSCSGVTYGAAPTMTNVSESPKTVCYKVSATNYSDKTGSYTCTMNKADCTVNLGETSGSTAFGTNKTTTVSTANGCTLSASSSATSVATASISGTTLTMTPAGVGDATITVTATPDGNHTQSTATYALTVTKGACTVNLSEASGTITYPTTSTTFTATSTSGGALSVSPTATGSNIHATAAISNGTVTVTPRSTGTQTITVTSDATTNYNACSATYTATVASKTITINSNGGTGTCAGGSITCSYGSSCTAPSWNSSTCAITKGTGSASLVLFTKWNTADNGSGTDVAFGGDASNASTLYAVWVAPECVAGTGVGETSLNSVSNNAPVCNKTSSAGNYCTASTQTGTAGSTSVTTTCDACSSLGYPTGYTSGTFSSAAGSTANTACKFTGPSKSTPENCATITANTMTYSGTAWPTPTYKVTSVAGKYITANNVANPTCAAATNGCYTDGANQTSCKQCSALTGVSPANGTYSSDGSRNAKTTCLYTAPNKTISGCATVTSQAVRYTSNNTWPASTYAVTANAGYIIANNNTSSATCSICTGATFSAGGTATSCSSCPSGYTANTDDGKSANTQCQISVTGGHYIGESGQNSSDWETCANWTYKAAHTVNYGSISSCDGTCPNVETNWTKGTGTGWSAVTQCYETRNATNVSSNCSAGQLKKNATNATTWGGSTISSPLSAKAGSYVSGQTCNQCATGSYTSAAGTQTSCTMCTNGTTTNGTGQTSCNATCINNNNYDYAWATPAWNNNNPTNVCTVSSCAKGSYYTSAYDLPSGFTPLTYLASTGTQFINTGFVPSADFKHTLVFEATSSANSTKYICGSGVSEGRSGNVRISGNVIDGIFINKSAALNIISSNITLNGKTTLVLDLHNNAQNIVTVNGGQNISNSNKGTVTSSKQLQLFALSNSYLPTGIRIYSSIIEQNGVIVHHFVPAKRNSDNVLGMYDIKTGTFKTNAGTGTFTAGPVTSYAKLCDVCSGATFQPTDGSAATSCSACPSGYTANTTAGKSANTQCQISCAGGSYVATAKQSCVNVGAGYYVPTHLVNYNSVTPTSTRKQCSTGLTTIGYGAGADEAGDCGRKLHVGTNIIYLRSTSKTTPSFRVDSDNDGEPDLFGNMSESSTPINMSDGASDTLKTKYNNKTYYIYDDSAL